MPEAFHPTISVLKVLVLSLLPNNLRSFIPRKLANKDKGPQSPSRNNLSGHLLIRLEYRYRIGDREDWLIPTPL